MDIQQVHKAYKIKYNMLYSPSNSQKHYVEQTLGCYKGIDSRSSYFPDSKDH